MNENPPDFSPADFDLLFNEQRQPLRNVLVRLAGEAHADDLLQETYIKAVRGWHGFQGQANRATWLHRIARNAALDFLRSRQNREAKLNTPLEGDAAEGNEMAFYDPAVRTKNIEAEEMHGCIREYLERLPASQREILELKDLHGLTNPEIAQRLGVTVDTAKIRLHRARAALRREMEAGCEIYQSDNGDLACDRRDGGCVSLAPEISSKEVTPDTGARCPESDGRISNNENIMFSSSSNCCAPTSCAAPAPSAATSSQFTAVAAEFVALGAAIGSNCEHCLRYHTAEALKVGISIDDIAKAIEMAEKVKGTPAQLMRRLAERLLKNGGRDSEAAPSTTGGCGCQ
jgi:RNA polymerase sigma-70 factor (ECF subfamily)